MLKGRLGLETARIPHADRHGLLWLSRGELCVVDGCLHFQRGRDTSTPTVDQIPHQSVSMILLGPGSSVTQDSLRLLARHGTLMAAVGEDGVRSYTALPLLPDRSDVARRQAELWGNPRRRISVARHMYALRLGEVLPHRDLDTLRGIEGTRVKNFYKLMAAKYGIRWEGRHYDRTDPNATDLATRRSITQPRRFRLPLRWRCSRWLRCLHWASFTRIPVNRSCWTLRTFSETR